MLHHCAIVAAAAGLMALAGSPQVPSPIAGGDNEIRLRAELDGNTQADGHGDFRAREENNVVRKRLSVEVEDFPPNTELDVVINGQVIKTITTNAFGRFDLNLRGPGVPNITVGDTLVVGPLSGVFLPD